MDNIKHIRLSLEKVCITIIIIALVMLVQGYAQGAEKLARNNKEDHILAKHEKSNKISDKEGRKVIVFYFHGNVRCYTCRRIERLTVEAVTEAFKAEVKNGLIELKIVNVEKPENNHFIKDYQLYTRSVIVSDVMNGSEKRWKNLQQVWELVRNEEAFKHYIQKEITGYLQGLPS